MMNQKKPAVRGSGRRRKVSAPHVMLLQSQSKSRKNNNDRKLPVREKGVANEQEASSPCSTSYAAFALGTSNENPPRRCASDGRHADSPPPSATRATRMSCKSMHRVTVEHDCFSSTPVAQTTQTRDRAKPAPVAAAAPPAAQAGGVDEIDKENDAASSNSSSSRTLHSPLQQENKTTPPRPRPPRMVEVVPGSGHMLPLGSKKDTWSAVQRNQAISRVCSACETFLFCTKQAKMVLCPQCHVISPLVHRHHCTDQNESMEEPTVGRGMSVKEMEKYANKKSRR